MEGSENREVAVGLGVSRPEISIRCEGRFISRKGKMRLLEERLQDSAVVLVLALLAAGLIEIFRFVARFEDLGASMPEFIGLLLLAGILYVIGVFLVERFRLGVAALVVILLSSVAFRVVLLPARTTPSDDVYRYQWDGRVQRAGLNPYVVSPEDPELEWLENPEHPEPPGEGTATIYPPLAEKVYKHIETVSWYKRVSTLLDVASVGMLLLLLGVLKQPLHRVLSYAWNPAVLVSFAMSGHFDSLAILTLLVGFFFLVKNRAVPAVVALALSFLAKFFPILLLATFLKRVRLAYGAVFAFVVAVFYVPFLGAGGHLLDGARNYARDWLNNASLFHVLFHLTKSKTVAELCGAFLLFGVVVYLAKSQAAPLWSGLILTGGVLLVSPTAYPWYFTWSIAFLCFYPSRAWLLMSVTCILGYTPAISEAAGEPLRNSLLMLGLEYGPVYLWLGYYGWVAARTWVGEARKAEVVAREG